MPLVKRTVEPVEISRNHVNPGIKNELDFVTNSTLGNVIRQLSSLSKHVEDIFGELHHDSCSLFNRTCQLNERVDRLKIKITQLNPTVEEVLLQDINMRKPFKSSVIKDQQIITLATRPFAITEVYKCCEPPPELQKLNPYRHDGKDSLKFYTEPGYFFELWCQAMQKDTKSQMKRHKKVRRPQKMATEPPKVPVEHCPDHDRKFLQQDVDQDIDVCRYDYSRQQQKCNPQIQSQPQPGQMKGQEERLMVMNGSPAKMIQKESLQNLICEKKKNNGKSEVDVVSPVKKTEEKLKEERVKLIESDDVTDGTLTATETRQMLRPNSLELTAPVNEDQPPLSPSKPFQNARKAEEMENCPHHATHEAAIGIKKNCLSKKNSNESTRTSLTMCKTTVQTPIVDKELSLLVEVVSSKHMSGAKVSSSTILGAGSAVVPSADQIRSPTLISSKISTNENNAGSTMQMDQMSFSSVVVVNDSNNIYNPLLSSSPDRSTAPNAEPDDGRFWNDFSSLPIELATKTSTPDSVDLPPPPSPPPLFFSQTPDSPSLISLPPLPPPPIDEPYETKICCSLSSEKTDLNFCDSLMNGSVVQCLATSLNPMISSTAGGHHPQPPQPDTISTASDTSLVTNSSGSTKSEVGTTNATDQPLVRDTRSHLLAAIREGIKLRKVEERRQKTEQKQFPVRRLDVQTIMEAAFEMRRKVLEENDSEEEEDEFDSNWSDDD